MKEALSITDEADALLAAEQSRRAPHSEAIARLMQVRASRSTEAWLKQNQSPFIHLDPRRERNARKRARKAARQ